MFDAFGKLFRILDVRDVVQNKSEFVAAESGDQIFVADAGGEAFGDVQNQAVAHRMSETVVDGFEAIDVKEKNGEFIVRVVFAFFEREFERLHKQVTVR